MTEKIKNLDDLQEKSSTDVPAECFIQLNHGLISRKLIKYHAEDGSWWVFNNIDDTEREYPTAQSMLANTNIGAALERGALYFERVEE